MEIKSLTKTGKVREKSVTNNWSLEKQNKTFWIKMGNTMIVLCLWQIYTFFLLFTGISQRHTRCENVYISLENVELVE